MFPICMIKYILYCNIYVYNTECKGWCYSPRVHFCPTYLLPVTKDFELCHHIAMCCCTPPVWLQCGRYNRHPDDYALSGHLCTLFLEKHRRQMVLSKFSGCKSPKGSPYKKIPCKNDDDYNILFICRFIIEINITMENAYYVSTN